MVVTTPITTPIARTAGLIPRSWLTQTRLGNGTWVRIAVAVVLLRGGALEADEVKLGGFWISDVSVQGIEEEQIYYFNRAGTEFVRPIRGVQGLKLSAYPQLGKAYHAIDRGDYKVAQRALEHVRAKASARWLQQWASHLLIDVYDRLALPGEAVNLYLQLAREQAPTFLLSQPPVNSLNQASEEVRHTLQQRISLVVEELAGHSGAEPVQSLLTLIQSDQSDPDSGVQQNPAVAVDGSTDGETVATDSTAVTPVPHGGIVLAAELGMEDMVTQLLVHQRFEQALEKVDQLLAEENRDLAMRLYQKGVAQLRLAQANEDDKQYHDAGLSFMSVLAYFPASAFAGPSLVEAGVVHSKIGQSDIAKKLYERASVLIDDQDNPRYAERLEQQRHNLTR